MTSPTPTSAGVMTDEPALWWNADGTEKPGALPVLGIQGLGYTADMWFRLVPGLAASRRMIRFDNRGVGRSSVPPPPWSISEMAADAVRVLDAAGVARAHVLGVSMGGLVAQELALSHRDRVAGLVLGATHPGGRDALRMDPAAATMLMDRTPRSPREVAEASVPFLYADTTPREEIDRDLAVRLRHPLRATAYWGQLDAMRSHPGTLGRLPQVSAPTLVVHGSADRLVQPGNSELLTGAIAGSEHRVIDGAGHVFWTDATELTLDLVGSFLERVDRAC